MKSKHDSSSDSRDSASNGAGKNDDSMSDGGDKSRSRTRSRSRSGSPSSKKDRASKGLFFQIILDQFKSIEILNMI